MKQIATNYTFNPTLKTVTIVGQDVSTEGLSLIINKTRDNTILYNLAQPGLGVSNRSYSGGNTVFTLNFDTASAGHQSTDILAIHYDDRSLRDKFQIQQYSFDTHPSFNAASIKTFSSDIQIGNLLGTLSTLGNQSSTAVSVSSFEYEWVALKASSSIQEAYSLQIQWSANPSDFSSNYSETEYWINGEKYPELNGNIVFGSDADPLWILIKAKRGSLRLVGNGSGSASLQVYGANISPTLPKKIQLVDRDGIEVSVKPSGQNAQASDRSLVVALSPNSNPVIVTGSVNADVVFPLSQAVTGPLTNTQLRDTPIGVSGVFWQATQPVSGPITNQQLRASDIPVTGMLIATQSTASNLKTQAEIIRNNNPISDSNPLIVQSATNSALGVVIQNNGRLLSAALRNLNDGMLSTDVGLVVKNINVNRLSSETYVDSRLPDISLAGEWNSLANNSIATIYTSSASFRRIRLNQIIFSWMYQGSTAVDLFGQFIFQYFNQAGTFSLEILKTRLKSGQPHTLQFPNGILSNTTGGSIRVVNQCGGGVIDTNWNVSLWEE
jgi:hypothetical protein